MLIQRPRCGSNCFDCRLLCQTKASPHVTLNKEINAALAGGKIKARLAELGSVPTPMSPAEFEKFIVDETAKWGKVIREAKIPLQ